MTIGVDGNEANTENRVGSGTYANYLIQEFSKTKSVNFQIYLKENPISDLPRPSEHFNYKVIGPRKFWTQLALPISLFFGKKPDVFFSTAHYGPRFSPVPFVVTIHDLSYLRFPDLFNKKDLYQLKNWSNYSIKKASHIIAPSKSTKADIINSYHVNESKVSVIYEGYDSERFKPQPKNEVENVKEKFKIKGDYIIFVGTLQPRKNIGNLISAFKTINESNKLNLVICGKKGWLYDSIFEKVKELELIDRVIFTDYVKDEDLPALLSGAQLYINPSLWEGFGIPVVEAQACGVPVAVSNTSSLPEIVGNSGLTFDPQNVTSIKESIDMVTKDNVLRKRLTKEGFLNIKRFSWESCAKETIDVLKSEASK